MRKGRVERRTRGRKTVEGGKETTREREKGKQKKRGGKQRRSKSDGTPSLRRAYCFVLGREHEGTKREKNNGRKNCPGKEEERRIGRKTPFVRSCA